jgi:hypothetical protein
MKKTEHDLELSGAYSAKLAQSCATGADWKSFRVGATSRERRRMQSSGKKASAKSQQPAPKGFA